MDVQQVNQGRVMIGTCFTYCRNWKAFREWDTGLQQQGSDVLEVFVYPPHLFHCRSTEFIPVKKSIELNCEHLQYSKKICFCYIELDASSWLVFHNFGLNLFLPCIWMYEMFVLVQVHYTGVLQDDKFINVCELLRHWVLWVPMMRKRKAWGNE